MGAIEVGLLYGIFALGVYLTFRVLNFPDLTVDGSLTTGAATAAALIHAGQNPLLATLAGGVTGMIAGAITGILHTKGKIDGLLAGILTMIALWSINLRIMGKSNLPFLREDTLISPLREAGWMGKTWYVVLIFLAVVLVFKVFVDWFLSTDIGLAIQATGNNEQMIRSFGVNTDGMKILTLSISNGLVGLAGALIAQFNGVADISMGIGVILVGLASVILGQALLGQRWIWLATLAVIVGAVLYRLIIFGALRIGFNQDDMKLMTALLVIAALLLPRWGFLKRIPSLRNRGNRRPEPLTTPAAAAPKEA
ncbi:ABC transporter permease [Leucobacter komagatae]|uniref:ABC transporter permease n=1 Tax=Leucobacter komagatae TaxID=55969 RepID=A0A0D0IPW8_9MICO|nr:ABC transporter permease [Leucobacter komagatae]